MVLLGRSGLRLGLGLGVVFGLGFRARLRLRVRVRLRLRVSNNIKYTLFVVDVLHFIHLYSVDGATVRRTGPSNFVHLMPSSANWA